MEEIEKFETTLYQFYLDEIVPQLIEKFQYENSHQVPRITKIVINHTCAEKSNGKALTIAIDELAKITGQKGVTTRAKDSIAGFGITKGDTLGIKVILRRKRMYAFLHRLIHLGLPRIRDFRGLNNLSFDGLGNYTFGINEQLMFPEMTQNQVKAPKVYKFQLLQLQKQIKKPIFY